MTQVKTLANFYSNWEKYQTGLVEAIKPLTIEQLALRAASNLRSVGEIARHIAGTRVGWFYHTMGEQGDEIASIANPSSEDPSLQSADELVRMLETTWRFMKTRLDRWTEADMERMFEDEWEGKKYLLPRAYIIWHLIEHDVHHGGEIAITMGLHGLKAPEI